MSDVTKTKETAREIIAQATHLAAKDIGDDAGIGTFAAWDSMAHVNIILALEERFNRTLGPDQIIGITSLEAIAILLQNLNGDCG